MTVFKAFLKGSAVYGGADFVSRLVAFITFPIIASHLVPSDFGALELVLTVTTLLGIVLNTGLNNAVQRFYWDPETRREQQPAIVSSGLWVLWINCLIALTLGSLAALAFVPIRSNVSFAIGTTGLIAALLLMVANQLSQYLLDVTRLHFAPWRFFGVSVLTKVLSSVAGVAAIAWLGWQLDGMLGLQALVAFVALTVAVFSVRKDIRPVVDWQVARRLISYGYPFIFAGLAFWLQSAVDRWMLVGMVSLEEVGIYSVANRLATVVMFVSLAFGLAWSPLAMKIRVDRPTQYRQIYAEVMLVLLGGMTLVAGAVSLFSREALSFLFPAEYGDSALPFVVLAMGIALYATQQVTAVGISLEQKTYLFARLTWATAGVNVVLNLAMIPVLGATGAAAATAISWALLSAIYLFYTQRLHPLPLFGARLVLLLGLWAILTAASVFATHFAAGEGLLFKMVALIAATVCCVFVVPTKGLRDVV
jgi:O-antigen/teichoic acid export membrane protein